MFIQGKGTTTEPQDYSFIDKTVEYGKTYFYRLKQLDLDGTFEYSAAIEVTIGAPRKFSLSQNYPNPFNPSTTIRYELPDPSNVTILIYDILGREVIQLVNEEQSFGKYQIIWNGKDNKGNDVASGLYLYRMVANVVKGNEQYLMTRKLLLLK